MEANVINIMGVPLPTNEIERLRTLRSYGLLDTPPEDVFDEIASLAGYVFKTPIALVNLLDERRQWFKARLGFDMPEGPREHAFCSYTILQPDVMVVPDALLDSRFSTNPMVQGAPGIRFYAGTPLFTQQGHALGTLCVIDTKPRAPFDSEQQKALHTLGRHLMTQIDVRYSSAFLAKALLERSQVELEQRHRLRESERELGRLNEIKDRFIAMLAHELRNPLAPILNAIEILRSPEPDDAVEIIERQVKHLARLVEDLLDLSRVTRGKISVKKCALDLAQSVRAAAHAARPAILKGRQRFAIELPEEPLWVKADPVRLEQIVSNLLVNAAKFTEADKQISLSLRQEGSMGVLRVRDEGIGIPLEMMDRIFEPFVQVEGSGNKSGLGLGLPLVRQLVQLHNGTVEVQSDGLGHGSEFIVRFQLIEPPVTTGAATPGVHLSSLTAKKHRVLVVEDNSDLGETLTRLIFHWGHEASLVATGSKAVAKALAFQPDVAVVDIGLPEMDGCAVAKALSSAPGLDGIRLIAMSGYSEEYDRARAMQAGFHEFLVKPVDPIVLRETLKR